MSDQTQMARARVALGRLFNGALSEPALRDLNAALDEAQNRPPQGAADGSIGPLEWGRLRQMANHFGAIQECSKLWGLR